MHKVIPPLLPDGRGSAALLSRAREQAVSVMRKHRLAELLLVNVIGMPYEDAHDEACRWEHVMSEQVEQKVYELLGRPARSPYGNPIPGLDELGDAKAEGDEPKWIADLYQDAFAKSDNATRKEAELLLPELGPTKTPAAINGGPDEHIVIEAPQGALALPSAAQPAEGPATPRPSAPPPAPIGLSVGFGAQPNRP